MNKIISGMLAATLSVSFVAAAIPANAAQMFVPQAPEASSNILNVEARNGDRNFQWRHKRYGDRNFGVRLLLERRTAMKQTADMQQQATVDSEPHLPTDALIVT